MHERLRPQPPGLIRVIFAIAVAALFLPLLVLVISSFQEPIEGGGVSWGLRWYREAINDPILLPALLRSAIIAFVTSIVATTIGAIASLALNRWRAPGRQALNVMAAVSLALPELVLALSLLSWFALLGVQLSLFTVIAGHITLTLPFATLVIGARMKALSPKLDQAARDLGASELQVLTKVNIPLLKPALLTSFLLCFLISFDDFLLAFFTTGVGSDTLPVTLYGQMKAGLTPKLHALAAMTLFVSSALCFLLIKARSLPGTEK